MRSQTTRAVGSRQETRAIVFSEGFEVDTLHAVEDKMGVSQNWRPLPFGFLLKKPSKTGPLDKELDGPRDGVD